MFILDRQHLIVKIVVKYEISKRKKTVTMIKRSNMRDNTLKHQTYFISNITQNIVLSNKI